MTLNELAEKRTRECNSCPAKCSLWLQPWADLHIYLRDPRNVCPAERWNGEMDMLS